MKIAHFALLGLLVLSRNLAAAEIAKITCDYRSRDLTTELKMTFEPRLPQLLEERVIRDVAGNVVQMTDDSPVASQTVCGVAMDFAKNCKASETTHNGNYLFNFDCGQTGVSGSLGLEGGVAQWICHGANRADLIRTYQGCRVDAR